MAGNSFGELFRITTFGESHGDAIGVIVDGVPPRLELHESEIQRELNRRKPGQSPLTTSRKESDTVTFLSGVFEGMTTGTPLTMVIYNKDARSKDYDDIKEVFRPGHADWAYQAKYGIRDYRGSGRASGRETVGRVAGGAVARKILKEEGVSIVAYTLEAAGVRCKTFDPLEIERNPLRACDPLAAEEMRENILKIKDEEDSCGGVVECRIDGVEAGLGEPVFHKLDALFAAAILSIGGVKGFELGSGFVGARMRGSDHNDPLNIHGFLSNNSGGISGGISTGQEIRFRAAVKPTSSISRLQNTININREPVGITIKGRHDPILCPRIVPVVEAMSALVLLDQMMKQRALRAFDFTDTPA